MALETLINTFRRRVLENNHLTYTTTVCGLEPFSTTGKFRNRDPVYLQDPTCAWGSTWGLTDVVSEKLKVNQP